MTGIGDLRGRNAILTGASRGLGVHVARALATEGVNLALAARSTTELERVREEMVAIGVKAAAIPTDVSDRAQLEALVARTEEEIGPPDILVNNAGVEYPAFYADYPAEDIEQVVHVNLLSAMLLTRMVLPGMLTRAQGHVVNMSSTAGKGGFPYETPYATTKAGLVMFTHTLRVELADEPVGVSVVCPGFVSEDGMYAQMEALGEKAPSLLRPTTPKKVADAVVKAIRTDASELIVAELPLRPLTTLGEVRPALFPRIHKMLGVPRFGKRVAEKRARGQR